ncbi:hypothetical protein AX16_006239 [Volvariella volvacea WC 439]|nr:hypothetical protein AX16_006239 [Volvariella volvacea WC 439]
MAGKSNGRTNGNTSSLRIDTSPPTGSNSQHSSQLPQPPPIYSPTNGRSGSSALRNLKCHPTYYLTSGDMLLLAGDVRFKVHSYFFERESAMFRDWLNAIPRPAPGAPRQVSGEDEPEIVLDVSPESFSKFLDVFYNPRFSVYDFTIPDWTDILDQAHNWGFERVKELAVREMEKLEYPTVDRLALYEQYAVDANVMIPLYAKLAKRAEPLTIEESRTLAIEATVMIYQAREKLHSVLAKKGPTEILSQADEVQLVNFIRKLLGHAVKKGDEGKKTNGVNGASKGTEHAKGPLA